jgi:hypothetical protein
VKALSRRILRLESYHGVSLQRLAQPPVREISKEELALEIAAVSRSLFRNGEIAFESFKRPALLHDFERAMGSNTEDSASRLPL